MSIMRCDNHGHWDSDQHENCPRCDMTAASGKTKEGADTALSLLQELVEKDLIGWRGYGPHSGAPKWHFYCEFCKAEHEDCTKIPHKESCIMSRITAHLATASANGPGELPLGMVTVPRVPPLDMVTEAVDRCNWPLPDIYGEINGMECRDTVSDIYRIMLDAVLRSNEQKLLP